RRFFFSGRRRHTRWPRDWSSDVCSSDLDHCDPKTLIPLMRTSPRALVLTSYKARDVLLAAGADADRIRVPPVDTPVEYGQGLTTIGRAPCRERDEGHSGQASLRQTSHSQ